MHKPCRPSTRLLFALALALVLALGLPALGFAQEGHRLFISQVGIGASMPSYPSAAEAMMASADSAPGVDRLKLALDLAAGLAVSKTSYVMARVEGVGDRVYDSTDYIQLNLYLYSLGLRAYLPDSGLYAEVGAGGSRAVVQTSMGTSSASDFAFGYGFGLGYSFKRGRPGVGLGLEARYLGLDIEGDACSAITLTANLCWQ